MRDHLGANSEVRLFLGSPWSRRDDDVVEPAQVVDRELCPVIRHERRGTAIDLGEQVEEIERERVGVVDEQRADQARFLAHNDQLLMAQQGPAIARLYGGTTHRIRCVSRDSYPSSPG